MGKKHSAHARETDEDEGQPLRAWHVIGNNHGDTTVAAHACSTYEGVLTFARRDPTSHDFIVVRAFNRQAWQDCELVDTTSSPEVTSGHHDQ